MACRLFRDSLRAKIILNISCEKFDLSTYVLVDNTILNLTTVLEHIKFLFAKDHSKMDMPSSFLPWSIEFVHVVPCRLYPAPRCPSNDESVSVSQ